jgi:hypothetical protein
MSIASSRGLSAFLAFLCVPSLAFAGTVRVHVQDSGAPRAGIDVGIGATHAITDERGSATAVGVPAGVVTVHIETAGATVASARVAIAPDEDVTLEVRLRAAGSASVVVVARDGAGSRTFFDEGRLRDLPSSGSLWSLVETAETEALTDRIEGGGLYLGRAAHVGGRGSSVGQTTFRLDDVDVTDPRGTGAPLLDLPLATLRGEDVQTALFGVDQAAPGAALTLLSREAGRTWHGGGVLTGANDALQGAPQGDAPPIAQFGSFAEGSAFVSGPLVADRLALVVTAGVARSTTFERASPDPVNGRRQFLLGRFSATPDDRDELGLLIGAQHAESRQGASFAQVHAHWARRPTPGFFWRLTGAYDRGRFAPLATPAVLLAPVDRIDGPVLDSVELARETAQRWTTAAHAERLMGRWLGEHHLTAGLSLDRSQLDAQPVTGDVLIPERDAGVPARIWQYGYPGPMSTRRITNVVSYVSDTMTTNRLRLEAGLRLDDARGDAGSALSRVHWTTVSPRLSARVDVLGHGRLSVLAGYARYQYRLTLDALAYGDPAAPRGTVSLWKDANGDGSFTADERGASVASIGPGGSLASIDPALRPPRVSERMFAVEARPGAGVVIRLAGVRRNEWDLLAPVDVGVPATSYLSRVIVDPRADRPGGTVTVFDRDPSSFGLDRYVLANPEGHRTLHEGYELTLDKPLGRFDLHFGATGYRTRGHGGNRGFHVNENDQGVLGESFVDPNSVPNSALAANDRLFFDRSYTVKLGSIYRAGHDLRIGVVARYEDGQPFARWLLVPDLRQGPTLVQAFAVGRSRFTFTTTVDARVEKGFAIGKGRAAVFVEGFNVIGLANEMEEDVLTSPNYRAVTVRQPPPAARVGVRLDF